MQDADAKYAGIAWTSPLYCPGHVRRLHHYRLDHEANSHSANSRVRRCVRLMID